MLNIETLAVDPKLAIEGTWAPFAGGKFLIARYNNPVAEQMRNSLFLTGDNMKVLQAGGEKADALAVEIEMEVMTTAVLLDWDDVAEADKALKYTPEVGKRLLTDERYRELLKFIENYSIQRGNYRERTEAEVSDSVKATADS